jgi:hypothetical protein
MFAGSYKYSNGPKASKKLINESKNIRKENSRRSANKGVTVLK